MVDNVDNVEIVVKAGKGGDGSASFRHEKFVPLGGPDGGDGGKGGDIYLKVDRSINNLSLFRHKRVFKAGVGKDGGKKKMSGKRGEDLEIGVPQGTVVYKVEDEGEVFVADLREEEQKVLIAKGGRGGLGNVHFATSTNQAPRKATRGGTGEEIRINLDLKIIADVGIIGYPNAGKSTLLAAVSAAKPKIADYPFTTLEPVLGEVWSGAKKFVVAEIPGLIEGAHLGKGLGYDFLRHAERTRVLVHLLDGSSGTVIDDWGMLNKELEMYKPELAQKPQIVAVNKVDIAEVQARLPEIKKLFKSRGLDVHFISGLTGQGLTELVSEIAAMLDKVSRSNAGPETPLMVFRPKPIEKRG
jgi:GTP-binding protein